MFRQSIAIAFSCILIFSLVFTSAHTAEAKQAKIAGDTVIVRDKPGLNGDILTKVHKGDTYEILGEQQDWVKIKLDNGKIGWVASWLVKKTEAAPSNGNWVSSNVDSLRVRKGPGLQYEAIGYMNPGKSFKQIASVEDWVKIQYNNSEGWAAARFITNSAATPSSTAVSNKSASVAVPTLNVRKTPDSSSTLVGQLKNGQSLSIMDEKNGWYHIKAGSVSGWVAAKYTNTKQASSKPSQTTSSGKVKVSVPTLNIRKQPNTNSEITGSLKQGEIVSYSSNQNGWYQVNSNNRAGWIFGKFVTEQGQTATKAESGQTKVVTATILNIRKGPAISTSIIGQLSASDKVTVIATDGKWSKVSTGNGTGWVYNEFLSDSLPEKKPITETIQILNAGTNLRSKPSLTASIVDQASKGETFHAVKENKDWYKVQLKNGQTAYVAAWIVSSASNAKKHTDPSNPLKGKTIVIDPGHGGRDGGYGRQW
ncbi:SH3 domain-containing protein [Bacillus tianshenii]|nr:SH3 domain-containing protein [Bacillus tianshenii]